MALRDAAALHVQRLHGTVPTVVVAGEIDLSNSAQLAHALHEAAQVATPVVLDVTSVGFIDASGLSVIAQVNAAYGAGGDHAVVVRGASAFVAKVFTIVGMHGLLTKRSVAHRLRPA